MGRGAFRGELSDEQRAIFAQILEGNTGRKIAVSLGASPTRTEAIIRKTCRQLNTSNRHEAARMIGCHYGWTAVPPSRPDRAKDHKFYAHHGTDDGRLASNMVQTEREPRPRSGYVRDAGNQIQKKDDNAGAYNEVVGRISISKIVAASSSTQRVLLMALLTASSALALSALVSAMQGFDKLFFS